jgi:predicted alpha/beta superfamily hydrolase
MKVGLFCTMMWLLWLPAALCQPELEQTQQSENEFIPMQQSAESPFDEPVQQQSEEEFPLLDGGQTKTGEWLGEIQQSSSGFQLPVTSLSERDQLTHSFQLEAKNHERSFTIHIALPYQYDETKKYPVLYLLDADFLFGIGSETAWILNMGGQVEPMIVVGIAYGMDWSEVSNLRFAYFSPTPSPDYPDQTGKAPILLNFIEKRLIPHIEHHYNASQERTFWSSSMGGLFSAFVIATNPTLFENYIISSPSLWWPDPKVEGSIFKLQQAYNDTHDKLPIDIFAAVGENEGKDDMLTPFHRWIEMLKEHNYKDFDLKYMKVDNGSHFSTIPIAYTHGLLWHNEEKKALSAEAAASGN